MFTYEYIGVFFRNLPKNHMSTLASSHSSGAQIPFHTEPLKTHIDTMCLIEKQIAFNISEFKIVNIVI